MLIRMPARKGHEESAVWVCPEFIEAMVPDKDKLSRAFVYMQSGVMHTVTVDEPYMAFQEIIEKILQAYKRHEDLDDAHANYWNKERNGKGKSEASSAGEKVHD